MLFRSLERNKVPYELLTYECDEFIDGIHSAEATGTPVAQTYNMRNVIILKNSISVLIFNSMNYNERPTHTSHSQRIFTIETGDFLDLVKNAFCKI